MALTGLTASRCPHASLKPKEGEQSGKDQTETLALSRPVAGLPHALRTQASTHRAHTVEAHLRVFPRVNKFNHVLGTRRGGRN